MALEIGGLTERDQQVKRGVLADMIQQFDHEMLDIRHEQGPLGLVGGEDLLGQLERFPGGGGQAAPAAGVAKANRLAGIRVQEEEGLGLLFGRLPGGGAALDHVAFGVADQTVRIQSQNPSGEMAAGPAQLAQGGLEPLGLGDGVGLQQVMHGAVGGKERQAIGQLKAFVPQGAVLPQAGPAKSRFMDQMQGQARGQGSLGQIARPGSEQIPGTQAQVLGHQEPQAQEAAGNLIVQALPDLSFKAGRVGPFQALALSGPLGGQEGRRVFGVERVEFFFAGRNRR